MARLHIVEKILFGEENKGGMYQQHQIMWKAHIWVLCTGSAVASSALTLLVQFIARHI